MSKLSHVGMSQCFFCQKDKDIILHKRLSPVLPRKIGIMNMEPCNKCKDYMKQGIIVISIRDGEPTPKRGEIPNPYRTGTWLAVKEQAIRRMAPMLKDCSSVNQALELRWMFIEDSAAKMFGFTK